MPSNANPNESWLKRMRPYAVVLLTWGTLFTVLWRGALFLLPDGLATGVRTLWADWAAHFAYANVFAYRPLSEWFTHHPLFYGQHFSYPFVVNLISGMGMRMGLSRVAAFLIPSLLLSYLFLVAIFRFFRTQKLTDGESFCGLSLFLLSGGMGFLYFFIDYFSGKSELWFPAKEYTLLGDRDIQVINFVLGEWLPQRAFLLGMPLTIWLLTSIYRRYFVRRGEVSRKQLVGYVLAGASLVLIHAHSFEVLCITLGCWAILQYRDYRKWLPLVLGTVILGGLFAKWLTAGSSTSAFMVFYPGWLTNANEAHRVNWLMFWWLNWGFFLPLAIYGSVVYRAKSQPFVLVGWFLFVAANLIRFQPWAWDNTKIFTYAYLFLSVPVVLLLSRLWSQKKGYRVLAIVLLGLVTASGTLEWMRLLQPRKMTAMMWNLGEMKLARELQAQSSATDVVLTSDHHHHWVPSLSGRQVLMGYRGWLGSYGIDYGNREREIAQMFEGKERALELLQKYQVKFVVVGPPEREQYKVDEKFFSNLGTLIAQNAETRVYRLILPK